MVSQLLLSELSFASVVHHYLSRLTPYCGEMGLPEEDELARCRKFRDEAFKKYVYPLKLAAMVLV